MKRRLKQVTGSKGFTLVEILVSITILSIVVTTFLLLFIQSAKTNVHSESVLNATYIAQAQMEEMHAISKQFTFEEALPELQELGFSQNVSDNQQGVNLMKTVEEYQVAVKMDSPDPVNNLGALLVSIINPSGKQSAQMETILNWEQTERAGTDEE